MGRTVPFTGVNPSDADADTENHPFGCTLFRVVEDRDKAVSSLLAVSLRPMKQAIDRLFYTLSPEGISLLVNRCALLHICK